MNFAVWITSACNMKCKYCYVDEKKGPHSFLDEDIPQLIQFMKENINVGEKVQISFFGGEPLLNFKGIQRIIDFISEKKPFQAEFYLTTNGLLITETIAKYFTQKEVFVSLSWDGCEKANDMNRIDGKGDGTYHRIQKAYQLLKSCGLDNVRVRATLNSGNFRYLADSVEDFLKEDPDISVLFAPDYFDQDWSDEKLAELQEILASFADKDLRNISILEKDYHENCTCKGGISNFHIYVNGLLYPCSFVVNEKQFCIGDIWNGLNRKKIKVLQKNYIEPMPECDGCDNAKYCLSYKCRYLNWSLLSELNKPVPIICQFENMKWCSNKI